MNYKFIAIIFFILGAIFYFVFPRDAHIEVPDYPPRSIPQTREILNENGCITYEHDLMVDHQLITGSQSIKCQEGVK